MRKFALSIIATLFFNPAYADQMECAAPNPPADVFIEATSQNHPDLADHQVAAIARSYEIAWNQQQLALNEELSATDRAFADRTVAVTMRIAAVQLNVFSALPQMQAVIEQMEAEEATGLDRVSAELEPDVRHAARTMVAIGLIWGEISTEVVELSTDRFVSTAESGNFTDAMEAARRTICTLEATMDVMDGVVDFFPNAITLAYVERLYY